MAQIIAQGIDVSSHNGSINWKKVKEAGIKFAMIRAGIGWSMNNKDKRFDYNVQEAQKNGIECGAYWFGYGYTPALAKAEAELFMKICAPYKFTYPLCYDFEYDSVRYAKEHGVTVTKTLASALAETFLSTLERNGYYVANYTNLDYIRNYFNANITSKYDIWLAHWGKEPNISKTIWQYEVRGSAADVAAKPPRATVIGKVDGVNGAIDMNYCYVDYPAIIRAAGKNRLNEKDPAKPVDPEIQVSLYTGKFAKGDIVNYTGTVHYVSANSTVAKPCIGGKAKVNAVFAAGKHPYSLIRVPGSGATVYGWVDEALIQPYNEQRDGIKAGSIVRLRAGATDYYGTRLASFVFTRNHLVKSVIGDKAIITYGGVTVAAVRTSDLTKIK